MLSFSRYNEDDTMIKRYNEAHHVIYLDIVLHFPRRLMLSFTLSGTVLEYGLP